MTIDNFQLQIEEKAGFSVVKSVVPKNELATDETPMKHGSEKEESRSPSRIHTIFLSVFRPCFIRG
jgi:hypothetical protein